MADAPYLILEEFAKGFDEFQVHSIRQSADIVMRLDRLRRSFHRNRFDDVRINRSLNQKVDRTHLLCLFFKYADEFPADDLALLFRIRHARQ